MPRTKQRCSAAIELTIDAANKRDRATLVLTCQLEEGHAIVTHTVSPPNLTGQDCLVTWFALKAAEQTR